MAIFSRKKNEELTQSLEKTRSGIFSRIARIFTAGVKVDDALLDKLEEALISADVGLDTTVQIIQKVEAVAKGRSYDSLDQVKQMLREVITGLLTPVQEASLPVPYVIMVVGVNGVGKTTTIGKLAHLYQREGRKVLLGAGDTFRAAAIDQLDIWAQRAGVGIIKQQMGADPASVAFDTVQAAKAQGADVVIIDTAGRLHNKVNLMNELGKIKRVMQKVIPDAPHEVLLVLDASTGQNAYEQAKQFAQVTEISALALTKLDGTAKGGVAIGISHQMQIPIRYIGIGEQIGDLQRFDPQEYVQSLFDFS